MNLNRKITKIAKIEENLNRGERNLWVEMEKGGTAPSEEWVGLFDWEWELAEETPSKQSCLRPIKRFLGVPNPNALDCTGQELHANTCIVFTAEKIDWTAQNSNGIKKRPKKASGSLCVWDLEVRSWEEAVNVIAGGREEDKGGLGWDWDSLDTTDMVRLPLYPPPSDSKMLKSF